MKKVIVLITILTLILVITFGTLHFIKKEKNNSNEYYPNKIVINIYKPGTMKLETTINITNSIEIKEVWNICSRIQETNELPQLELLTHIDIILNENISIGFQGDNLDYCYYKNTETTESYLTKTPSKLKVWMEDFLNNNNTAT